MLTKASMTPPLRMSCPLKRYMGWINLKSKQLQLKQNACLIFKVFKCTKYWKSHLYAIVYGFSILKM